MVNPISAGIRLSCRLTCADPGGLTPTTDLFDEIVRQFQATMPVSAGRLRLPTFWVCREVLEAEGGPGDLSERGRDLRNHLYGRQLARSPVLHWLNELAGGASTGGIVQRALAPVVRDLPRWLYGRWLNRSRRLRSVGRRLIESGIHGGNFLGGAVELTRDGVGRANHPLIRSVLMTALLLDLSAAFRPPWLSAARRRRPWPYVLLLPSIGDPGSPSREFLDAYNQLVVDEATAPLMILAGCVDAPPKYAEGPDPDGADLWRDARVLRGVFDQYRSVDHAPKVVAALLAAVVVTLGWIVIPPWLLGQDPTCPMAHASAKSRSELIGITDGACNLGETVWPIEQEILHLNQAVGSRPHRTVVFFAPLSLPSDPEHSGPSSALQLRGTLLAQIRTNAEAATDRDKLPIRLLIANPGDRFVGGEEVAEQIVTLTRTDSTVAAVIGISQSRDESRAALRTLSRAKLPVIGVITGDDMTGASRNLFQVTPRNLRIAIMLAEFARKQRIIETTGPGGPVAAGGAIVVSDPSDYYSRNLAADFVEKWGNRLEEIDYSEGVRTQTAEQVATRICGDIRAQENSFMFYAGRAQQFPGLLNAMPNNPDCAGQPVTVLAGTALTVFVTDPTTRLSAYPFLHLYYAAFSSPTKDPTQFSQDFAQHFPRYQPDSDAAAGYDALLVASNAVNQAFAQGNDADFDPDRRGDQAERRPGQVRRGDRLHRVRRGPLRQGQAGTRHQPEQPAQRGDELRQVHSPPFRPTMGPSG